MRALTAQYRITKSLNSTIVSYVGCKIGLRRYKLTVDKQPFGWSKTSTIPIGYHYGTAFGQYSIASIVTNNYVNVSFKVKGNHVHRTFYWNDVYETYVLIDELTDTMLMLHSIIGYSHLDRARNNNKVTTNKQ